MAKRKSKNLQDKISESNEKCSRIQKKLGVFLLEHWNEIPLMSIEHIARETGVSTATISRYARQYNFKGFFDFKDKIKEEVKNSINPVDKFRLMRADLRGKKSLVTVARQDVKNLNKLLSMVKEESFSRLVEMVDKAPRVFSFGKSISSIFADFTSYIFNQIRKEAHTLDESVISIEERILSVKPEDMIIFCSFLPYSRVTIEYAQLAKERGLQVVAISDNEYSPISEFASLVLAIPRENVLFTTSFAAFSVLINAVAVEIAYRDKERLTQEITQEDRILKRFYFMS